MPKATLMSPVTIQMPMKPAPSMANRIGTPISSATIMMIRGRTMARVVMPPSFRLDRAYGAQVLDLGRAVTQPAVHVVVVLAEQRSGLVERARRGRKTDRHARPPHVGSLSETRVLERDHGIVRQRQGVMDGLLRAVDLAGRHV